MQTTIQKQESLAVIYKDVMIAIAYPAIAAFGHPVHPIPITQQQLSVTYFISHIPVADPAGSLRSCNIVYLHGWSVCRSNAGSIACPDDNVTWVVAMLR